jgi:hypothetical protein
VIVKSAALAMSISRMDFPNSARPKKSYAEPLLSRLVPGAPISRLAGDLLPQARLHPHSDSSTEPLAGAAYHEVCRLLRQINYRIAAEAARAKELIHCPHCL